MKRPHERYAFADSKGVPKNVLLPNCDPPLGQSIRSRWLTMSARSYAVWDMVENANRPERLYIPAGEFDRTFEPSRSARKIGFGRRVSQTHQLLMTSTNRIAICESKLESDFAKLFDVDHSIADIEEQLPSVELDGKGKHWPDFRLTFEDGTRLLVAVKPDQIADNTGFLKQVYELGRAARKSDIADGAIWLGNSHLNPFTLANAVTIRFARQCKIDPSLVKTVSEFLSDREFTRIQDLLKIHPHAAEAGWIAVSKGIVEPADATPELSHNVILVQPKRGINPALRMNFGATLRAQEALLSRQMGAQK